MNLADLKSKNPAIRRKALLAFGPGSILMLKKFLAHDPSSVIRHEAAFLLGATESEEAVKYLIHAIKTDKSNLVRHEAIEALGDLGVSSPQALHLLLRLTRSEVTFIRETAEIALETLKIKQ